MNELLHIHVSLLKRVAKATYSRNVRGALMLGKGGWGALTRMNTVHQINLYGFGNMCINNT